MKRALIFMALSLASIAALGTTQAQANIYCAELPTDVSCTQNFSGLATSIQAAVDAADSNPGADSVKVGSGHFVMASPVFLSNFGEGNKLTLTGSGDSTVLSGDDPTDPDINFSGGTGSSISNLTVSIPDDATDQYKTGLILDAGATGSGLYVTFAQHLVNGDPSPGKRTTGVQLSNGATLKDSTVRLYSSNFNDAVAVYGSGNVVESSLTAYSGVYQRNATGTVEIRRSAMIPIDGGTVTEGGTINIHDSVILNSYGGTGVIVTSDKGPANVLIDGSTILGVPGTTGATVQARRDQNDDPGTISFRVNNSIIYGQDFAIAYEEYFAADTLNIDVDSSAYDSTRVVEQPNQGTPTFEVSGLVELSGVDPKINGDYSLKADSPLIDAGQAALPPVGSLAFDGNPRACDGNDDGTIRRDIGAFEFRSDPNDDCTYSVASISDPQGAATDTSRAFTFTASKANSTFLCSLDGAAFTACATPYTASGLSVGNHNLKVKARDAYGNIQAPPTEKSFTVEAATCVTDTSLCPDPTCETDPSLCPAKDTTAPEVTGLKAPKKTKQTKVKVSFKSNEAGSTFRCRLNKGKWKKCKSPWKTPKLKKGKNTVSIQATDKAGNKSKVAKRVIKKLRKRN